MTATIPIDASGRLVLPKFLREKLNLRGGAQLRASIVSGHIELVPVGSEREELTIRKSGIAVLKKTTAKVDAASAVKAERDALAERALRR